MPRLFTRVDVPPPFFTVVGGTTTVMTPTLPQQSSDGVVGDQPSSTTSTSTSTSIIIVIIIIASAIIVSATLYLLLRYFSRHFRRSLPAADDVVNSSSGNRNPRRDRCLYEMQTASDDLINSLPIFTFGSVTGNIVSGDCAVCLSKFEPNDQLRLLPLCCHAFHAQCIDAWLSSNQTCPLCRSTVHPSEADVLDKILSATVPGERGNSFRIEIGSLSRRRGAPSDSGVGRRSYSVGSFDYIVEDGYEVSVASTHRRDISDCDKDSIGLPVNVLPSAPPEESLAAEVAERSWLRDYMDRLASSISSRTVSFRSSGRFFTGSSRRSDIVVPIEDLETYRIGEEISELFRWLSGV